MVQIWKTDGETTPLYLRVAEGFERQIEERALVVGDKLPSVRVVSGELGVSVGTAVAAYEWLERRGWIEVRQRSGHYVAARMERASEPRPVTRRRPPTRVALADLMIEVQATARDPRFVHLGEAMISSELLPTTRVNRAVRKVLAESPERGAWYEEPAGALRLRRQIAHFAYRLSWVVRPEDVIVTNGLSEALALAIGVVARRGEVVAVEGPGCYETLRALESLDIEAVEIPARPGRGPDLEALESAAREHGARAFLTSSCCHNPLGHVLADAQKAAIVALAERLAIPIIEDDSFGDLAFSSRRPKPLGAFDATGNVIHCGSCSHLLAPGWHLGWLVGGRFSRELEVLKAISSVATSSVAQSTFAELYESGAYHRYLRRLVRRLCTSTRALESAVIRHFPPGTRVSHPDGGFFVWVQLPQGASGLELYRAARAESIAILPGELFSAHRHYRDCVRLSCGWPWSDRVERAVGRLGSLAAGLVRGSSATAVGGPGSRRQRTDLDTGIGRHRRVAELHPSTGDRPGDALPVVEASSSTPGQLGRRRGELGSGR